MATVMKQYSQLIVAARQDNRKKLDRNEPTYVYFENHHIWPVAFGRDDRDQNLVLLTFPEHVLAHVLLAKLYPKAHKIQNVAARMLTDKKGDPVSIEAAAEARELASAAMSGDGNPSKKPKNRAKRVLAWSGNNHPSKKQRNRKSIGDRNRKLTIEGKFVSQKPENRKAQSERWTGEGNPSRKPENQKAASERWEGDGHPMQKQKNRDAKRLAWEGESNPQKSSKNRKAKSELWKSDSNPARKPENQEAASKRMSAQVQCPHCDKTGGKVAMGTWHFDNCLQHPDNLGLTRQQIKAKRNGMLQVYHSTFE